MNSTPTELVLSNIPDAKQSGSGWSAPCPAHKDRNPSLSITEGDEGRVLLHCHAGCSAEAITETLGLKMSDLMPPTASTSAQIAKTRENPQLRMRDDRRQVAEKKTYPTEIAAVADLERRHGARSETWTYHDAGGEPVGLVVRWDRSDGKKDIRPVSKNGQEWTTGGMAEPRPLYCLPDLGDAKRVCVCEGEKAADAARSIGLVATTSAHGSGSARKADWSPLAGRNVVILPDNDDAGAKYADDVATILSKLKPAPTATSRRSPKLRS